MRSELHSWLVNWEATHGLPEVSLYDFGDGATNMPISKDGLWIVFGVVFMASFAICYLHIKGYDKPNLDAPHWKGVSDMGNGWLFYGVEIKLGTTREELFTALDAGKEALLKAVK